MPKHKLRFAEHATTWQLRPHAHDALSVALYCTRCDVSASRALPGGAPQIDLVRAVYAALVDLEATPCRRTAPATDGTVAVLLSARSPPNRP
jgi:hypothetical protein